MILRYHAISYSFAYFVHSVHFCIFEFPINAQKVAVYS